MRFSKRRAPSESGFTLIEVLIAIAILGTVAAMVSLSFSSTLRIRETALDDGGREHVARNCLKLMAEELSLGRWHPASRWIGRNADQEGRPADLLVFTSAGHVRVQPDVPETDLTRVVYIREGSRLVRYSTRNLFAFTTDAVEQIDLATGVTAFNLRYYDRKLALWLDEWAEGPKGSLPAGVMIELTLLNARQEPRTYTAWVPIPPTAT
jgi:general secretion pathway protein J